MSDGIHISDAALARALDLGPLDPGAIDTPPGLEYFDQAQAEQEHAAQGQAALDVGLLDKRDRTGTARLFLRANYRHPECLTLLRSHQVFYRSIGSAYAEIGDDILRAQIRLWLDRHKVLVKIGENEREAPYKPSRADVGEVAAAVEDLTITPAKSPAWLHGDGPDPRLLLPCKNVIVNLATTPPLTMKPTPRLFTTSAAPFAYEPHAPKPAGWLAFLDTIGGGDRQFVDALQEWFGYTLTADTSLQKILLLVGPPRSGKGTIARVLTNMIGLANCVAPTLASLATNFGLANWINAQLAVIGDARLSARSDSAVILERLLSISGQDAISIDRKFLPSITTTLSTRIMLLSNELPRLNDPSGAIASRFVLLVLRESYLGREDTGLTDRLLAELPGILNWSIEGWHRLAAQRRFTTPASSDEAIDELAAAVSPMRAFIADWCHVGPEHEVPCGLLFDAWRAWCDEQGRATPGTVQTLGLDLRAALPAVAVRQHRGEGGTRERYYAGIGLPLVNTESARVWRAKHETAYKR